MILNYITFGLLILAMAGTVWALLQSRQRLEAVQQQLEEVRLAHQQILQQQQLMAETIHELRTGTLGVGHKVKELASQIQQTQVKQEELQEMDGGNKLYHRAVKMVEQGYSVDELMEECELPRAEAELLFNLHKK